MIWPFSAQRRLYLDYASATPILEKAREVIVNAWQYGGNPGAIHADGVAAARVLADARERIARILACKSRELIFVSGGTEANNLAILGFARKREVTGRGLKDTHWIVSAIEHPSVLECMGEVERLGGIVTYVDPDERGIISPDAVMRALRPETVFISIGWANSEIGIVQPIRAIVHAVRAYEEEHHTQIIVHSDAGQAPVYLIPHVHTLGVDLFSLDAGKIYGPRGIGALYLSNRVELARVVLGGGQERGLRAGTENAALATGFAVALEELGYERTFETKKVRTLRDSFAQMLLEQIPGTILNTDLDRSLPHILNVSIPDINSEYFVLALDHEGISISTKSVCREGEASRSHVVSSLGGESWRAENTLRFSLGRESTENDIERAVEVVTRLTKSDATKRSS